MYNQALFEALNSFNAFLETHPNALYYDKMNALYQRLRGNLVIGKGIKTENISFDTSKSAITRLYIQPDKYNLYRAHELNRDIDYYFNHLTSVKMPSYPVPSPESYITTTVPNKDPFDVIIYSIQSYKIC